MMKRPIASCSNRCAGRGTFDPNLNHEAHEGHEGHEVSKSRLYMKLIATFLTLALVAVLCSAQPVAELVKQIPVQDTAAENALAAKLMAGGPAVLKELCA